MFSCDFIYANQPRMTVIHAFRMLIAPGIPEIIVVQVQSESLVNFQIYVNI